MLIYNNEDIEDESHPTYLLSSFLPEKSTKKELRIEISKYYLSRASNIFLTSNKLLIKCFHI